MKNQRTDPIRQAVAAGEFHRATLLWNEYAAGIREEIGRGACTEARMAEAGELLEWSRGVALCDRAHAQSQLTSMRVAAQYGPADTPLARFVRASL
ncbi:MAG: hypothetical protein LAQ69_24645 [Acidobacteriia bacterium]|nr:hypothetical protein [Terriglobia bacterium]